MRARRWFTVGAVTGVVLLGAWAAPAVSSAVSDLLDGPDASEPSCSWAAVRISGADTDQAGLIRCYLRAVAEHSSDRLATVVRSRDNGGPSSFSDADFAHAAVVAGGVTTVTVVGNTGPDPADAAVTIRYADGSRQVFEIHLANPQSAHSWRFWDVGVEATQSGAPAAKAP